MRKKVFEYVCYFYIVILFAAVGGALWGIFSQDLLISIASMVVFAIGLFGQTRFGWGDRLWHAAGKE